jgi:serine/threonine protein kinase
MALAPGTRLGPYVIAAPIGAGGMGEVYKATDTRLDRTVAVKVLPAEFSVDPDHRHRFEHEAHAIAALNHPHICTVHDVGRDMGIEYLVMEYIDGPTLRKRLQDGLMPVDELLTIVTDVAEGLSEAHERGIVHRDLKPGNIMLTRNGAKLLDFGLAKVVHPIDPESTALQTATGVILGTVAYMSPERLLGLPADRKGDVFSLGVVLYEMVAGARPFGGTNMIETIDAILHKSPERISRPDLERLPELNRVVFKCLEKDAADRYSSATDLLYEIQCLQRGTTLAQPVQAVPFRRHNLPLDLTSFVGRERELEELKRLLDEARCVSLVGAGGCGKTRLALKTASEMLDKFRDGVI